MRYRVPADEAASPPIIFRPTSDAAGMLVPPPNGLGLLYRNGSVVPLVTFDHEGLRGAASHAIKRGRGHASGHLLQHAAKKRIFV